MRAGVGVTPWRPIARGSDSSDILDNLAPPSCSWHSGLWRFPSRLGTVPKPARVDGAPKPGLREAPGGKHGDVNPQGGGTPCLARATVSRYTKTAVDPLQTSIVTHLQG